MNSVQAAPIDAAFDAVATFDGNESKFGDTVDGAPYLLIRGVTVDTGDEIVERTVMAFGADEIRVARSLLSPGTPVRIRLRCAGPVMKVAIPDAAA